MENNTLAVENLHVSYDKLEVLWGVTFEIARRDFVALIGANGAGKSTVLKAIAGMLPPREGRIWLLGQSIDRWNVRQRLRNGIAYVPQGRKVFASLTVKENLELLSGEFDHVLSFFPNLQEKLLHKAGALSGGEQQMLSIARAMLFRPKFLLLDEPSLGLSPRFVEQIFEIFKRINAVDKVGILLVEQNVQKALEHSHFGYILEMGRIKKRVDRNDLADPEFKRAYLGI